MDTLLNHLDRYQLDNIFISVLSIALFLILQKLTLNYVGKKKWSSETTHLRFHMMIRNTYLIMISLTLFVIWIPQIQSVAFSLAAIAVAIAVSLKEMIMMFTGGIIRSTTNLLTIGDRIEINHYKGDVIRAGFFTTDVIEVGECGQRTGRILHIPNSYFLSHPLSNDNAVESFVFHIITIPVAVHLYNESIRAQLYDFAKQVTEPYEKGARDHFRRFSRRNATAELNVEPRVLVQPHDHESFHLVIRIPTPIAEKINIEQMIIRRYAELIGASDHREEKAA